MRAIGSAPIAMILAMTMMVSSALAEAPASAQGALAPGKPAGARQAQLETGGVLLVVGILALAAVIAIVVSTSDKNNSTPSTTS